MIAGFRHCDAAAVGSVDALAHLDVGRRVEGVRLLLAGERLDVPLAVLVDVIDHPRLFGFAAGRLPGAFADGHQLFLFDLRPRSISRRIASERCLIASLSANASMAAINSSGRRMGKTRAAFSPSTGG